MRGDWQYLNNNVVHHIEEQNLVEAEGLFNVWDIAHIMWELIMCKNTTSPKSIIPKNQKEEEEQTTAQTAAAVVLAAQVLLKRHDSQANLVR